MVPLKVSVLAIKITTTYLEVSDSYIMPAQKYAVCLFHKLHTNVLSERLVKCSTSTLTRPPMDKQDSSVSKPLRLAHDIEIQPNMQGVSRTLYVNSEIGPTPPARPSRIWLLLISAYAAFLFVSSRH